MLMYVSFLNVVEVLQFDDLIDLIPLVSMHKHHVDKQFFDFVVHLIYFESKEEKKAIDFVFFLYNINI